MFDAETDALATLENLWVEWEAFPLALRVKWYILSYMQGQVPHEIGIREPGRFHAPK